MKNHLLLIFILFLPFEKILTQQVNFLPMAIGNAYQYTGVYNYWYWKMDRDTIYTNGYRYFTFPNFLNFGDCRIDSAGNLLSISKPFFLNGDPEEYQLFKANSQLNEIWPIAWNYNTLIDTGYGECIFDDTLWVFGERRRVKGTLIFDESYYYYYFWLAEGIGLIMDQYDDGSRLNLNYAIIDGIQYGELLAVEENIGSKIPSEFEISQNYPNPFNPKTTIKFSISEPQKIKLSVFSLLGEEIKVLVDEYKPSGIYSVVFDGTNLPSGAYIYALNVNGVLKAKCMILLK